MYDTAHELRNFITVIIGYADLGMAGNSPASHCFLKIREAAEHQEALLKAFFNRGRAAEGPLNLNAIAELARTNVLALPGTPIEVVTRLDVSLPMALKGDAGSLYRAVQNICFNARKAMPRGGRLTLRTYATERCVCLEMADTASGLTPEEIAHLWDPHVGAEHGRGLSIARSIVQQLDGSITVESALGRGTTFTIALPVAEEIGSVGAVAA